MLDPNMEAKFKGQGEMLANRVKKRFKHLSKRFARENIEVFRLYDWDIPEIRAVVDWYAGHLVVGEYVRTQSVPQWLPMMGEALSKTMEVPPEKVHLKERKAGKKDGKRYERIDHTDEKIIVSERDLKFLVNPNDFVDTGLFSDHRNTRKLIRELAEGKDFLNLYCYTGAFSCYAAKGGAKSTLSVDRSETAIKWARENMALNRIPEEGNKLVQAHTFDFLKKAKRNELRFDLAVVDPPFLFHHPDPERGIRHRLGSSETSSGDPGPHEARGGPFLFHQSPELRAPEGPFRRYGDHGDHGKHHSGRLRAQKDPHPPVLENQGLTNGHSLMELSPSATSGRIPCLT